MAEFTQVEAEKEITIYPEDTNASIKIWRKGDNFRLEIYNGWGTIDAHICITKQQLLSILNIISEEVN